MAGTGDRHLLRIELDAFSGRVGEYAEIPPAIRIRTAGRDMSGAVRKTAGPGHAGRKVLQTPGDNAVDSANLGAMRRSGTH